MEDNLQRVARRNRAFRRLMLELDSIRWHIGGKPSPPPKIVKYKIVKSYVKKLKIEVVVETGTYLGDFVAYMLDSVKSIYSIEISKNLHYRSKKRFEGSLKTHLVLGDSREVLPDVLAGIEESCLFWLDAHCSGGITSGREESPILEELRMILGHSATCHVSHLIIVDDASDFVGTNGYPTIPEVERTVTSMIDGCVVEIHNDMIHIHSPELTL